MEAARRGLFLFRFDEYIWHLLLSLFILPFCIQECIFKISSAQLLFSPLETLNEIISTENYLEVSNLLSYPTHSSSHLEIMTLLPHADLSTPLNLAQTIPSPHHPRILPGSTSVLQHPQSKHPNQPYSKFQYTRTPDFPASRSQLTNSWILIL